MVSKHSPLASRRRLSGQTPTGYPAARGVCGTPGNPSGARGPIEPLPGWSGVLHHVLACCCPSAISVGPLTRLACMLRTQGLHIRRIIEQTFLSPYRVYGCLRSKRCISWRGSECRNLPAETFQRALRCTSHSMALVIALDCISHRCMHCTFACHNVALLRGTRLDCLRNSASALCSVCSHPPITFCWYSSL